MRSIQILFVFIVFTLSGSMSAWGQNEVNLISLGDGVVVPIVKEPEEPEIPENPEFFDQFFTKPIVFNRGWDQRIGHRTRYDQTVNIQFRRLEPVFGFPGIIYTGNEITHWGEQQFFTSPKRIYATGVLLIDRGDRLEGGRFEWSLNRQGFMSFHNITRRDVTRGWIGAWTDPRPGDTVHFFIMSDDERFASNPITFTWCAGFQNTTVAIRECS